MTLWSFVAVHFVRCLSFLRLWPQPKALPFLADRTLSERLESLGLAFMTGGPMSAVPKYLRNRFIEAFTKEPICAHCHGGARILTSLNPTLYPGQLGWFCVDCGFGGLFKGVRVNRNALGMPDIQGDYLFVILITLERQALDIGIISDPDADADAASMGKKQKPRLPSVAIESGRKPGIPKILN